MKIRDGFLLKQILGDYLVVPTGDNIVDFAAAVSLNESGSFLWKQLENDKSQTDLVDALVAEYELPDRSVAETDVGEFISLLKTHGFLAE